MAVGMIRSENGVKWSIFRDIAISWVVTLPVSGKHLILRYLNKYVSFRFDISWNNVCHQMGCSVDFLETTFIEIMISLYILYCLKLH